MAQASQNNSFACLCCTFLGHSDMLFRGPASPITMTTHSLAPSNALSCSSTANELLGRNENVSQTLSLVPQTSSSSTTVSVSMSKLSSPCIAYSDCGHRDVQDTNTRSLNENNNNSERLEGIGGTDANRDSNERLLQ